MRLKLLLAIFLLSSQLIWAAGLTLPARIDDLGVDTRLRMWGWSPDGKVAYSEDYHDDADQFKITFVIFDTVKDEAVITITNHADMWPQSYDADDADKIIQNLYNEREAMITQALKTYDIRKATFTLQPFPLIKDGKSYEPILDISYLGEEEGAAVDYYSLYMQMTEDGTTKGKDLGGAGFASHSYYAVDVVGYFLSPFENRILVVTAAGATHYQIALNYHGCHLGVGFISKYQATPVAAAPDKSIKNLSLQTEGATTRFMLKDDWHKVPTIEPIPDDATQRLIAAFATAKYDGPRISDENLYKKGFNTSYAFYFTFGNNTTAYHPLYLSVQENGALILFDQQLYALPKEQLTIVDDIFHAFAK
ncbi:MAG: hypothetical protein LBV04_06215 [Deferribacteraceae bacterium]|jgi:hypothetical protein|nr:hypothetical protein [Deferribacteraceae bacterium]